LSTPTASEPSGSSAVYAFSPARLGAAGARMLIGSAMLVGLTHRLTSTYERRRRIGWPKHQPVNSGCSPLEPLEKSLTSGVNLDIRTAAVSGDDTLDDWDAVGLNFYVADQWIGSAASGNTLNAYIAAAVLLSGSAWPFPGQAGTNRAIQGLTVTAFSQSGSAGYNRCSVGGYLGRLAKLFVLQ